MIAANRSRESCSSRFPTALILFCFGALFTLTATSVSAQTASSGSLTGQVADPQGAAIPGVDVTLLERVTNSTQTTVTNESGRYVFAVVNPGTYEVSFSKNGFKKHTATAVKVSIGIV